LWESWFEDDDEDEDEDEQEAASRERPARLLGTRPKEPNMTTAATPTSAPVKPTWEPLGPIERRVLGVLIEKAKTTPDAYPLSLNAIRTGCNQRTNRFPVMDLEEDAVQEAVDGLREKGVVIEVQGGGRVAKYRHLGYEWLGVDKREVAVMTELLLRGAQTVGELRAHASRMEPIPDLPALHALLDGLAAKKLIVWLTPEGRGQVVAHALYSPNELQRLRAEHGGRAGEAGSGAANNEPSMRLAPVAAPVASASGERQPPADLAALRQELADAKEQIAQLRDELKSLRDSFARDIAELRGARF
jgi:uncharacterized protein YceH (UPF0502 family)